MLPFNPEELVVDEEHLLYMFMSQFEPTIVVDVFFEIGIEVNSPFSVHRNELDSVVDHLQQFNESDVVIPHLVFLVVSQ